jgi:hypothetical protein
VRERMEAPLLPIDRPQRDALLAQHRAELGEQVFDAAWNACPALSVEQAVALCREPL